MNMQARLMDLYKPSPKSSRIRMPLVAPCLPVQFGPPAINFGPSMRDRSLYGVKKLGMVGVTLRQQTNESREKGFRVEQPTR